MRTPTRPHKSSGFTLVEAIIVMVILAIASLTIASMSSNIFNNEADNKIMQTSLPLLQECAEQVLAMYRASGYSITPSCDPSVVVGSNPAFSPFNFPDVSTNLVTSSDPACPSSACKIVTITPRIGTTLTMNPVTLLLVGP